MTIYRGRFAPSPTGALHFGSLFAAVVSYLEARANGGEWIIRIEDIDPLREEPDAADSIIETLAAHGLRSDAPILYQSTRYAAYHSAIGQLIQDGYAFLCPCSRKYLIEHKGQHSAACQRQNFIDSKIAIKFKANNTTYSWHDEFHGFLNSPLIEDFVLKRKEGFYAYQLAVVCDDIYQGITHVVRGYDLLDSTPMQLALYQAFNQSPPFFGHFPVITALGQKLSKQNKATPIRKSLALENLLCVFSAMNLSLPRSPKSCEQALELAIQCWDNTFLRKKSELIQLSLS